MIESYGVCPKLTASVRSLRRLSEAYDFGQMPWGFNQEIVWVKSLVRATWLGVRRNPRRSGRGLRDA